MPVAVVTDSTHYLPREIIADYGIHQVSLYVNDDGTLTRESEMPNSFGLAMWVSLQCGGGKAQCFRFSRKARKLSCAAAPTAFWAMTSPAWA